MLRANMYDLEEGERSVFDQELARERRPARPAACGLRPCCQAAACSSAPALLPAALPLLPAASFGDLLLNAELPQPASSVFVLLTAGMLQLPSLSGRKRAPLDAAEGPSATWVAVQQPAKRPKAAAGPAAPAGGEGEHGGGEEGASPAKAGGHAAVLAHNAAVKADAREMRGRRCAFLDTHLDVGVEGCRAARAAVLGGGACCCRCCLPLL